MLEYFLNLTDVHCPNSNDSDKDYYTAQTDYRLLQFRLSGKAVSPGKLSSLIRQFFSEYTDAQEMDINQVFAELLSPCSRFTFNQSLTTCPGIYLAALDHQSNSQCSNSSFRV
ncbi:hypothetical protein BASA83_005881 [Batrachochytrium salamandrivorans]|nr:hypothetical protein BASA83_005881 [Batrachochytrium salamandrivorans]